MQVLESYIEGKVVAWAKKRGFLAPKVKFVEAGYPDRLFISPAGHTVWIEFKRPGERPDPLQVYRLRELTTRRQISVWCDNYDDAISILKECLEPTLLSDESNTTSPLASISGAVPGPWPGEDIHCPGGDKDPEAEGPNYESPDRSPAPTHAENVAGRDTKMARFPGDDVDNPARGKEGGKT